MRQHFRVINDFANNRQFDKIAEYLEEYSSETNDTVPLFFCENLTLDALLHFYVSSSVKNSAVFYIVKDRISAYCDKINCG